MQSYEGSEKMVGMFLTSIYVIAKIIEIAVRLRLFKNATWTLLQSVVSIFYIFSCCFFFVVHIYNILVLNVDGTCPKSY